MANVLITTYCNRNCSYCFAKEEIRPRRGRVNTACRHISAGNMDKVIRFFKASGMKEIGVLGGEPTLHPRFPQIIGKILRGGFNVKLFTGGLVPDKAINYLKTLDPGRTTVIINTSGFNDRSEYDRMVRTLRELSGLSILGYTIYHPDFDASFLIDLIIESHCRPTVRLGIGLPMADNSDPIIHPNEYKTAAHNIIKLAEECDKHDVALKFDCGFAFCMFMPEELGRLRAWNCESNFCCSPILDIGPDLDVWPCFPFSSIFRTHLSKFRTRQEAVDYFIEKTRSYRNFGIYDKCHDCKYKRRMLCAGGCLTHTIRSFH